MKKIFYYLLLAVLSVGCLGFVVRAVDAARRDFFGVFEPFCVIAVALYFALTRASDAPSGENRAARQEGLVSGFIAGLSFSGEIDYDEAVRFNWSAIESYRTLCELGRKNKPIGRKKDVYVPINFPSFAFSVMESHASESRSPIFAEYVAENKARAKQFVREFHHWE